MKSWHIQLSTFQLAKVRLRTETEVASLQTSDCTRLSADLNGKFNFNFSVHGNRGCVADEIISTIFVLIRWNASFNFWTLTMKVRWKWKRKWKWGEKVSATADVKAPVCLHASPNADLIQILTFVLYHIIFNLDTTDSVIQISFIPFWCDRNLFSF